MILVAHEEVRTLARQSPVLKKTATCHISTKLCVKLNSKLMAHEEDGYISESGSGVYVSFIGGQKKTAT